MKGPTKTVSTNKCVLNVEIGVEAELEDEGVEVVGVLVFGGFEEEGEGEVVEGDVGAVHVGEEGEGEGGGSFDEGVEEERIRDGCGVAEEEGGRIAWGFGEW